MGNEASSDDTDVSIGIGKLKIEQYPSTISEHEWEATDSYATAKQSKEALITKKVDRRIRAEPQDYDISNVASFLKINKRPKYDSDDEIKEYKMSDHDEEMLSNNPIYNIVRLKMKYSEHCHKIGSGVIIHHTLNKAFVLTAAHNVVELDEDSNKKLDYPESVWIEINKNTSTGYKTIRQYSCCGYKIHTKYIKYLKKNGIKESETGYDIAVIEVLDPKNELKQLQKVEIPLYKSPATNNNNYNIKVKVIGYPGEQHLRGQLYGMIGDAQLQYVNEEVQYNKLIAYDIDTTAGQSGCPIFKVLTSSTAADPDDVIHVKYENNVYKSLTEIVGVHVAAKRKKKLNFGTVVNDEIVKWIHKCIDGDCIQYRNCPISVLLITSSKSKYATRLNEIHKKCQKTEVMSTMRLYYDYADEMKVRKQDFLYFVETMFKSEGKEAYLIFYCGESDESGNWKISAKYNVTLNDLIECSQGKDKKSKFYIVSDCNQSGNWIAEFKFNSGLFSNEHKTINGIQASSKENEACNTGTFTSKYSQCCFQWKEDKESNTKSVGVGVGLFGALTVGTLYDGVIKQPYHAATKYSQPQTTKRFDETIGYSRDGKYRVEMCFYSSWYRMDWFMTEMGGRFIGGASEGLY